MHNVVSVTGRLADLKKSPLVLPSATWSTAWEGRFVLRTGP